MRIDTEATSGFAFETAAAVLATQPRQCVLVFVAYADLRHALYATAVTERNKSTREAKVFISTRLLPQPRSDGAAVCNADMQGTGRQSSVWVLFPEKHTIHAIIEFGEA